MTEKHTISQESIQSFDYDPNLLATTSTLSENKKKSKNTTEFAIQTDVTVSNRKKPNVVPRGVEVAVQTAYTLSKSEATNSSITVQLQVEKTHEDIEVSLIPSDYYQINATSVKKLDSIDDVIPNLPPVKSVSVLQGDVLTRRCDNQQWKDANGCGKESERIVDDKGIDPNAPTSEVLKLQLDQGNDRTEDVKIGIVARPSKQFGRNDINDTEVELKNSRQIANHQQMPSVISKDNYELVVMTEVEMLVAPNQVQPQYLHTLMPLSDEHTSSVLGLVNQHGKELNFATFVELSEDHITGQLKKVGSQENIFLWGIVGEDDDSLDSDVSVYEHPAKKERAVSHIDKMRDFKITETQSNSSLYSDHANSRQNLLNATQTRMIFEMQPKLDESVSRNVRPSCFNTEFAFGFKMNPDEETDIDEDEVEFILKHDALSDHPDGFETISHTEVTDTRAERQKGTPLSIATLELNETDIKRNTNVFYNDGSKNASTSLTQGGSPLSIQLSVDGGCETNPAVLSNISEVDASKSINKKTISASRDGGETGTLSPVVEPESEPITMRIPTGDENIVLTITTKTIKKDGDKRDFMKPLSNSERKEDLKISQKVPEIDEEISNGNYNNTSRIMGAAESRNIRHPEVSNQTGRQVEEYLGAVIEAIAESITPLQKTLETIRRKVSELQRDLAITDGLTPLNPTSPDRANNSGPPVGSHHSSPQYFSYDCEFDDLHSRPPRYVHECHRYEPRLCWHPPPFQDQDYPYQPTPSQYQRPRYQPSPNQYQGSRYQHVPNHDQRSLCPLAEMYVTLSQPRNVTPDSREGVEGAVTESTPAQGIAVSKDQSVLGNIDARCTKCGSEDVELRVKNQDKDGGGACQQASSSNNNNNNSL